MRDVERNRLEEELRALCERKEFRQATEQAVRGYGREIHQLMLTVLRDEGRAQEAFSLFCECLVKGLPRFRWESSFRTWAQRMARNACFKLVNAPAVRHRHVGLSEASELSGVRRSSTPPWQRTPVKERFQALREKLTPQEQRLMALRLDQRLPWPEVVRAMSESPEPLTSEQVARRAAALRQQFQRLKGQLRTLARRERVFTSDDLCA